MRKASIDPAGYDRESNYLYLPMGAMATCMRGNEWLHNPKLEFDLLLYGKQESHLSDIAGLGLSDVTNQQHSGYCFRFSYGFLKKYDTNNVVIEPFLRYWYIDDSEAKSIPGTALVGLEPENKTLELGIRFIWRFY